MALFDYFNRAQIDQGQAGKEVTANAILQALSDAAGASTKSIAAGGTINLSQQESEYGFLDLTGAPGSTTTVVKASGSTSIQMFRNSTTGGQTINVKMNGGTSFAVPAGQTVLLISSTIAITIPLTLTVETQDQSTVVVNSVSKIRFRIGSVTDNGGGDVSIDNPFGAVILLCEAFTPAGTGADTAEVMVPYHPKDGTTSVVWNVRRIWLRVNVAGGAPALTVEKSTVTGAFSATSVGTLTMGSGNYEVSNTTSLGTVASGDKLRFNVGTLATATGWTVGVELGAFS